MLILESLRDGRNFCMLAPDIVLECRRSSEVQSLLEEVEEAVRKGYFAAGFLSYEAGFAFLPYLPVVESTDFPLAWFSLCKENGLGSLPEWNETESDVVEWQLDLTEQEYGDRLEEIRRQIQAGNTYQVNFTMRYRGILRGTSRGLYNRLRRSQRVSYAAYIETPDWAVVSLSPELFFHKKGNSIEMKPMKGTAPRGRTLQEDQENAARLQNSPKERSENLMIVDLLRNDLGKICETGTIEVIDPMKVERYETLLQMTSGVKGRLFPETGLSKIFQATFPSGSVTGAPKLKTMQIIQQLENSPRRIYTGAIGFAVADEAMFNVAIRTLVIDHRTGRVEMGTGSGILYEADAASEYEECRLKAKFLTETFPSFELLETLLWEPATGYFLLDLHLERLAASAEYFLFPLNLSDLRNHLAQLQTRFANPTKLRILLQQNGTFQIQHQLLEPIAENTVRVRFSQHRTHSGDRFLYHKTTYRPLYDSERRKAQKEGCFEVLFLNEKNEVTEGSFTNIFVEKAGVCYTPPVSSGLLPGVFRRHLLETQSPPVIEKILYPADLIQADQLWIGNSVRKLLRATLTDLPF